jgi:hypothetical protein
MKDDRLRVPFDKPYIEALGSAAYVFACLEWNAVWCCERMEAGYIRKLKKKTAGVIADDLVRLAGKRTPVQSRIDCLGPANEFKRLVNLRNGIFHGKPGTASTGEQRLFKDGHPWMLTMITDAPDEFAKCSISLNALHYN